LDLQNKENEPKWPPIPGDFTVGNPDSCVALCTLGKKIDVNADFGIIGTCKTENIGIERIIINVISNPTLRFLILSGPEVPGHRTGASMVCLHKNGVDSETRKIIDAPGAIPYIENVPLEGVERFREQVEFIDIMNNSDPEQIAAKVQELQMKNPGCYPEEPMWIDFKAAATNRHAVSLGASISLLPELGLFYDPSTSLLAKQESLSHISQHPSGIAIEMRTTPEGTILVGKEL